MKREYLLIITPSADPTAPAFDELLNTYIKDWLIQILGIKTLARSQKADKNPL